MKSVMNITIRRIFNNLFIYYPKLFFTVSATLLGTIEGSRFLIALNNALALRRVPTALGGAVEDSSLSLDRDGSRPPALPVDLDVSRRVSFYSRRSS